MANANFTHKQTLEDTRAKAVMLQHKLRFLMNDLEEALRETRGTSDGATITLKFQRDGIDALLWLAGAAWADAADLAEASLEILRNGEDITA